MSEMLTKLGINWTGFVAQLVNFMLLFLILRAFAWKPLLKALEDRRAKIKKGVADAKRAEEQLLSIEKERDAALSDARSQAMEIVEDAKKKAASLKEEKMQMAKTEIEKHLNEAKSQIEGERTASYLALKQDVAKLISTATGKIVKDLDAVAHEKLIKEAIQDLETV